MDDNLDIFKAVEVETSVLSGQEIEISPVAPVLADNPIEFVISAEALDRYIIPNTIRFRGAYKITTDAGAVIEGTENVAAINNAPHSFFKAVNYSINGTQLNDQSTSTYPYRAYLEHLLSFSEHAKSTHLRTSGWAVDKFPAMHSIVAGQNPGHEIGRAHV